MAITVAMRTQVSELYVALFGRAPDAEGLGFWTQKLDEGNSFTTIANAMYDTAPARAYYPLFLTNEEIVASFYVNVLGRTADAEGLAYWTAKLNAAGATPGSVIADMIDVVVNYTGTDPDGLTSAALFNNKVEVAQYYGEHSGNIDDATVVLAGVTADPATVTAAEAAIAGGTIGQNGIEVALTTGADLINGSAVVDSVTGVFGNAANATFNAGDVIDLGAGTQDALNLVANGVTASDAVIVKNTELINITDTVGATFNATLIENTPGINFLNTQTGLTSMVTSGATGSVYGLSGKGNLTVDFASTSGTSDTANLSLAGVGTSTAARSTVNVSDTNTIEKVAIATTGTNYVTLNAGSAAGTLTITGNGTNNFDISAASATAALLTLDASASTGANTFAMGTSLGAGDTVKGGTGTDTVSTNFTAATLNKPTMTGVETLSADFDAAAILDLGSTTGLTTMTLTGSTANQVINNAPGTVTTLNVSSQADNDNTLTFGYASTSKGDLTMNVGSTSATATSFDLNTTVLKNTTGFTLNTLGALTHNIASIDLNGDQSHVNVSVAAGSTLDIGGVEVTGDIGSIAVTVGAAGAYSGYFNASGGTVGDVSLTVGASSASGSLYVIGTEIGNVTVAANGNDSTADAEIYASNGSIGNISYSITGDDASGHLYATASGGSIGDITLVADGDEANIDFFISAGPVSGAAEGATVGNVSLTVMGDDADGSGSVNVSGGDVGNITLMVDGNDASGSLSVQALYSYSSDDYLYGGNIGNITATVNGDGASGTINAIASGGTIGDISLTATNGASLHVFISGNSLHYSGAPLDGGNIGNITVLVDGDAGVSGDITSSGGDIGDVSITVHDSNSSGGGLEITASMTSGLAWDNGGTSSDWSHGGSIGNVTVNIDGANSNYDLQLLASGGDIGTVNYSINGSNSSGYLELYAHASEHAGAGNIGAMTFTQGDDTALDAYINLDGSTSLSYTGGDGVSGDFYISGGNGGGAALTSATMTMGDHADFGFHVSGFSGSFAGASITAGDDADIEVDVRGVYNGAGAVSITTGASSDVDVEYNNDWAGAGTLTLAGGDAASTAAVDVTGSTPSFGGIVATTWGGSLTANLAAVTVGTTVQVGAGGSSVTGTEGADNVFLGAGVDTYHFDTTPTAVDTLFSFTGGAGKDVIDVVNAANFTAYTADTADTLATGDFTKLTDIAGGQDITTAAGLLAALNTGGEYASIDTAGTGGTYTFITASTASSTTYYVFDATDANDADADFDTVTLVGIVNGNAFSNFVAANVV